MDWTADKINEYNNDSQTHYMSRNMKEKQYQSLSTFTEISYKNVERVVQKTCDLRKQPYRSYTYDCEDEDGDGDDNDNDDDYGVSHRSGFNSSCSPSSSSPSHNYEYDDQKLELKTTAVTAASAVATVMEADSASFSDTCLVQKVSMQSDNNVPNVYDLADQSIQRLKELQREKKIQAQLQQLQQLQQLLQQSQQGKKKQKSNKRDKKQRQPHLLMNDVNSSTYTPKKETNFKRQKNNMDSPYFNPITSIPFGVSSLSRKSPFLSFTNSAVMRASP